MCNKTSANVNGAPECTSSAGPITKPTAPQRAPWISESFQKTKQLKILQVGNLIHWQLLRAQYSYSESLSAPLHPVRASSQQTHSHWIPRFTKDPLFPRDSPMLHYITGTLGQQAAQKLVLKSNRCVQNVFTVQRMTNISYYSLVQSYVSS